MGNRRGSWLGIHPEISLTSCHRQEWQAFDNALKTLAGVSECDINFYFVCITEWTSFFHNNTVLARDASRNQYKRLSVSFGLTLKIYKKLY